MGFDGSLRFDTKIDTSGFEKGVSSLKSAANKGAKAAIAAFAAVGVGLTAAAAAAIKVGSDFEAGMSQVSAVSGATGEELEQLTAKAKEMGEKTKFSATESAEAFNYMAMAGWKTSDMLGGIEGIMNLAAASGEDLASVSDIVTDALTAFGLTANDSGHFADVLAKASSNANTNVGLMGATFKYVAPVAGAMKYSVEDTSIAIGLMANAGIKGEQAGTALRAMFTRLVKPPQMAAKALDDLRFSAVNADGSMKPLRQVIDELREKFSHLTDSEKASYAANIAGTEAMSGFLSIMNASENDINKLTAAVDNADGAAKQMADTMNDNLKGQITILGSGLEGLGIKIYEKFENPLKTAAKTAVESVGKISKSMTSGELSKSVDKLAESTGRFLSSVANLVANGLPKLINGFALVVEHGRTIISVLAAAATAVAVFKGAMVINTVVTAWKEAVIAIRVFNVGMAGANATLTFSQAVVAGLTGEMKLAAAAQAAWSAVMAISPIGMLAVAIAAATAALVVFASTHKEEQTEIEKSTEKIKEESAALEEEKQAREALKDAKEESIKNAAVEIDHVEKQIDALNGLKDANGEIAEGDQARAKVLADQINNVLPNAISLIEEEGKMYLQVADNIQKLIDQKRIDAMLEAGKEEYNAALSNQVKLMDDLATASTDLAGKKAELVKAQKDYDKAVQEGGQGNAATEMKALDSAKKNVAEQQRIYDERKAAVEDCCTAIQNYEDLLIAAKEGNAEKAKAVMDEMLSDVKQYGADEKDEALKQYSDKQKAYTETCEALKDVHTKAAESMIETSRTAAEDAKTVALNSGVDIADINKISGKNAMDALAQGQTEGKTAVAAVTEAVMDELIESMNKEDEVRSIGGFLMQGLASGIESNADAPINKAAGVALRVMNAMTNGQRFNVASPSKWAKKVGGYVTEGLAIGLSDNTDKPMKAAADMALGVMDTVTGSEYFDIHSPSKWSYKVSDFIAQGLANGFSRNAFKPVGAASQMARDVMGAFTKKENLNADKASQLFYAVSEKVMSGMEKGIQDNGGYVVGEMEHLAGKILSTGDALSTGIISKDKDTNEIVYDTLYHTVMDKIDVYYKDRDKRISLIEEGTEETIKSVQKEVKETEKATDLKIKLYQQEYKAKMQLIDDESSEVLEGLQSELDAIDAAEEKKQRRKEEEEYQLKMQELYSKLQIADAEDKQSIIAQIDKAEAERKQVLDKQALEDKKEHIRQQMEEERKAAAEKKKQLQEELDAKEYQLQQQRAAEVEYMNTVIELMQSQVEKKKELTKLQEDLVKAQAQQESDELARAKEEQTKKNETELEKQERAQKEKKRTETQNTVIELGNQITELKKSITDGEILLRGKVKNAQLTEEEITGIVKSESEKRKAAEGIGITFDKEGISDKEVQAITARVQENITPVVVPVELQQSSVQTTQTNVLKAVSDIQPQVSPVNVPITLGELDRRELEKLDVTIHNAIEVNMEEQNSYAVTADRFMEQWGSVPGWYLETVTTPMSIAVANLGKDMETTFQRTIKNIQDTVKIMPSWTQRCFFTPVAAGFKSWSNGLIQTIEGVANSGVSAINELISRLNSIRIEPPDWLKEEGYEDWRVSISKVSGISIPRLAAGGVIPPGRERLFIAGDNKTENEIIAPESTFRRLMRLELEASEQRRQEEERRRELFKTEKFKALFAELEQEVKTMSFAPMAVQAPQNFSSVNHYDNSDRSMNVTITQPVQSPSQLRRTLEKMSREMAMHG